MRTLLAVGALCIAPLALRAQGTTPDSTPRLEIDRPIARDLAGGGAHSYRVHLAAGAGLRLAVEQQGIDVIVTAYGPDGRKITDVDSPNGTEGPEPLALTATDSGDYRIEVRALEPNAAPGRYEIRLLQMLSAAEVAAAQAKAFEQRDSALAWLWRSAIRLRTVEAGNGYADLEPLRGVVGGARVVALGEATHGTREFFQLKHRLLEFLVERMGFSAFAIEATMPEAFDVNRYVLTGQGDPGKALASLYFWTWNTEEVLDLIRWMRRYNADPHHHRKVDFYGFDMQSAPRAAQMALAYLRRVDRVEYQRADSSLGLLADPFTDQTVDGLPAERRLELLNAARSVLASLDDHRRAYVSRAGSPSWVLGRQHARIVVQNLSMRLAPESAYVVRDRSMAENLLWILDHEGPGARVVAWAHNGHVADDSTDFTTWMGHYLRRALGASYRNFGFAFGRGGFQAMEMPFPSRSGLRGFHVDTLSDSTLDGLLARSGLGLAALDLRALPDTGRAAEWFAAPRETRSIGAGYADAFAAGFVTPQVTPRLYDALLYVDSTTAARGNPSGRVGPQTAPLSAPTNLDFEETDSIGRPSGWSASSVARLAAADYRIASSNLTPARGAHCAMVARLTGPHFGEWSYGLAQQLDATPYRGHRVRFHVMARMEAAVTSGRAYVWMQATRPLVNIVQAPEPRSYKNVIGRAWREYELEVSVPANATTLTYGLALTGDGRAWIDAASLEVVPQ